MNCFEKPPGRVKQRRIEKTTICPAYKSRHRMSVQNCRSCVVFLNTALHLNLKIRRPGAGGYRGVVTDRRPRVYGN